MPDLEWLDTTTAPEDVIKGRCPHTTTAPVHAKGTDEPVATLCAACVAQLPTDQPLGQP